jgi:hypothetical protein
MRLRHDLVPPWALEGTPAWMGGAANSNTMDLDDLNLGLDMFYEELKWNKDSGLPTKAMYEEYPEMASVYDTMNAEGLIG